MASARPAPPDTGPATPGAEWLSLTHLGRTYGISAVQVGRLLVAAGLRTSDGQPTEAAVAQGLSLRLRPSHHHQALWHGERCEPLLLAQGLEPLGRQRLVGLWADLLSDLEQGSPGVATTAEEMADDLPRDLVTPVNRALRQRGCSFQVRRPLRPGAAPRPACSPSPAADAGPLRRHG
ncbi:MAG: hypothetical protein VKM01_02880 [Cyanobacteriota bacterium]|nr:hypothetical protein [Cyanobacteriota bacterium]